MRTALGNLGFSLTVLRLFDHLFYRADTDDADDTLSLLEIPTVGQEHKQSYGRPFVTDGNTVAVVAFVVAGTEITLFVVVLQLREYMEAVQLCSNLAREV
ncbi:hypothetical protein BGW80DRAFT_1354395 [Lactifluus volemus]|nr:hypothetical protein BGW80DRAFT_1354395 [Lactifluus volemus]